METKKVVVRFIALFASLQWSGSEPAMSPRSACVQENPEENLETDAMDALS